MYCAICEVIMQWQYSPSRCKVIMWYFSYHTLLIPLISASTSSLGILLLVSEEVSDWLDSMSWVLMFASFFGCHLLVIFNMSFQETLLVIQQDFCRKPTTFTWEWNPCVYCCTQTVASYLLSHSLDRCWPTLTGVFTIILFAKSAHTISTFTFH